MKTWLLAVLSLGSSAVALPPYFLLAGDSTTATQSSNGGGWGDGFLNKTLKSGASGYNYGHNVRRIKNNDRSKGVRVGLIIIRGRLRSHFVPVGIGIQ